MIPVVFQYFNAVCATKKKPMIGQKDLSTEFEGNGVMSQLLLEALDGFIMIITTDGQLFYVSESVKDFLGYSQATLIHQSLFKFLHVDDHKSVKENLVWNTNHDSEVHEDGTTDGKNESDAVFKLSKCEKNFTCRIKCTLSHGGGFYKMFQCHGKMREIHIKKREIDNVEYGLFAVISPINSLPSPSTMEMVRKEAILGSQRRFQLDPNITGNFPSLYKTYMDSHHLRAPVTPKSEPATPTSLDSSLRPSFFPPSFNYVNDNYFRPCIKRRSSSSSGINDDSSTTDENASSEGSCDGTAPHRRVSFLLGNEEKATNYGKKEKISHRRMSAPTFPSTLASSSASSYGGMSINAGNMNWLFPNPLTNPLLTYPDLLHRVDGTPFMTSGLLSPMFSGYSPGAAMYGSFSPNPFMKRAASFPNVYPVPTEDPPAMLYPPVNRTSTTTGQTSSASVRMHGYDPFSYFMSNSLSSRRASSAELISPSTNYGKDKVEYKHDLQDSKQEIQGTQTNEDEDVEINVTEDHHEQPHPELPIIQVQDYDTDESASECKKISVVEEDVDTTDDDDKISSSKGDISKQTSQSEDAGIHETLADIAHSFSSKLDSIKSSFTMSLDRNVASCLGKK